MLAAVTEEGESARFLGREVECKGCWEVGTDSGIRSDIVLGMLGLCWEGGGSWWGMRVGGVGGLCRDQLCGLSDAEVEVVSGCGGGWQMGNYFGHSEFPQGKD